MTGRAACRAVLLGASNLTVALPFAWKLLRRRAGGPLEALVACGRGRSYGTASRFLFVRTLPGILESGLWDELARRPPLPTVALLTDIGNDLVYGQDPATVAGWVEDCAALLAPVELGLSLLPLASIAAVPAAAYGAVHRLLFPLRPVVPRTRLLERAGELNERLRRLGQERGARVIEPPPSWFGRDPIHLRRRVRPAAWERLLDFPSLGALPPSDDNPLPRPRLWPELAAEQLELAGISVYNRQPTWQADEGSTLALY